MTAARAQRSRSGFGIFRKGQSSPCAATESGSRAESGATTLAAALPKAERKRLQVEHAGHISQAAQRVKLADKICNVRDVASEPPKHWDLERRRAYFEWAREVVDGMRGANPRLEAAFDEAYRAKP